MINPEIAKNHLELQNLSHCRYTVGDREHCQNPHETPHTPHLPFVTPQGEGKKENKRIMKSQLVLIEIMAQHGSKGS
jgi:hypothetical protein